MSFAAGAFNIEPEDAGGPNGPCYVLTPSVFFLWRELLYQQHEGSVFFIFICHLSDCSVHQYTLVRGGEHGRENTGFAANAECCPWLLPEAVQLVAFGGAVHVDAGFSVPHVVERNAITAAMELLQAEYAVLTGFQQLGSGFFSESSVLSA